MNPLNPYYGFIDPACGGFSMSRFGLLVALAIDLFWVIAVVKGWPPKESFGPVSLMLGGVTATIAGIYAVSTAKSAGGVVEVMKETVGKVFKSAI